MLDAETVTGPRAPGHHHAKFGRDRVRGLVPSRFRLTRDMEAIRKRRLVFQRDRKLAVVRAIVAAAREAAALRSDVRQNVLDVGVLERDLLEACQDAGGFRQT